MYAVIYNYRTYSFQRHNLVNTRFIKISRPEQETMLCKVLSELRMSKTCTAFTVYCLHQCDVIST